MKYKKYINKLTKTQEKKMPEYAQKWIDIGLRTGETDWKTFDKYFPICYKKAGIKYPKNVVRVQSPLIGALAASIAKSILASKRIAVDGAVGSAVGDAVGDAVSSAVDDAVGDAVGDAVDGAVSSAVRGAVRIAVDGAVSSAVGDAVDGAVKAAFTKGMYLPWHSWLGGQFWIGGWYWGVAFVNFFFDVCKLKLSKDIMERAYAYRKVCESVNYIWPNRRFVIVCARPSHIDRDEQGRLHSETRQAIQYPDGWGLWMIHGVRVNEKIIKTPELLTKEDWINEKNTEVRRIIQDRMPDFVEKVGAKKLHKDKFGTLVQIDLLNDPENIAKYIKVKDASSSRMYYLRVPPIIKTAKEGVAWSFGLNQEEYKPEKET